ncbi:hypothetical protein [uncultured Prevotella sp.]|uniref:hypothetical protein n=1 Tax=uncultured Prevotella sp. TaxID=159272 RepID=UPI0025D195C1|nr:hypothetical protein [uncultured Prevotella sp.]
MFNSSAKAITRAGNHVGADAAGKLNNNFVVEGIKTVGSSVVEVFDNYNVNWTKNTADKTLSNTANWEYVGQAILSGKTEAKAQTIKYWDYAAKQYDFWAYSLGGGSATVSSLAHDATLTSAAYTFTGSASDLAKVYISDLVTAYNPKVTGLPEYQQQVNLTFRALVAKIRVGLYETIPGYSVKNVQFYPSASGTAAGTVALYAASAVLPSTGTSTVYFPTVGSANKGDADYNKAHISFASEGTKTANQTYGTLTYGAKENYEKTTGNIWLARNSAQPTWAVETGKSAGEYSIVLPNESGSVLTLKVDYTLESTDGSGEEITVHGATALVPAQYTQWKSNYAYTYIFKISDNTNGKTDVATGPEGLYPITFDAVVVDSEENTQETITTVATPSITTYSVTSNVTTNNEYKTSDVVYVTVTEDGTLLDMTGKAVLYTVSKAGATEAEVLDALNTYVSNTSETYVGRNEITLTPVTDGVGLTETEIPLVDGNKITGLTVGTVGKLKAFASAGTYAFVYTKTAASSPVNKYQEVTKAVGDDVTGLYTYDGSAYTAASGTAAPGTKYYTKYIENNGVYGVKVIKVVN